ncbi:MAG: S8 family serine peptidase [Sphingomicrobium sp.]
MVRGEGERLHAEWRKRFWALLGGLALIGAISGFIGGFVMGHQDASGVALPPSMLTLGAAGVVLVALLSAYFSWRFFITVGAVDVALQPAGFTSYGKSIDLYANGFEVPAKVPGGMAINISGTSLAAPQVTNLAAKMIAVNPTLTVAEIRSIIEATATAEGPKGLKVINPAAALKRAAK